MKVGDILSLAAALSGKEELSRAFADNDEDRSEEDVAKFFDAYEITIGELCEEVAPLLNEEELSAADGKFYYTAFGNKVLEIVKAEKDGKEIPFKQRLFYVETKSGEVKFTYVYAPKEASSCAEECVLDDRIFSKRVVAKGVASEYLITVGAFDEAVFLRKAYEAAIEKIVLKKKVKKLKKRIWA